MTTKPRISLKKAEENVRISLKKKDILELPTCAVGFAVDVSGSTTPMFHDGSMSNVFTRFLAVAKTFDDNGEMDMWAFNEHSHELPGATEANHETYVEKEIIRPGYVGGGTYYSPVIKDVLNHYFPKNKNSARAITQSITKTVAKSGFFNKLLGKTEEVTTKQTVGYEKADTNTTPAYVFFLTDGENSSNDISAATAAIESSKNESIYWMLVGVGHSEHGFRYLKQLADKYPNVGYVRFDNLDMSDEELYDNVITKEAIDWLTK